MAQAEEKSASIDSQVLFQTLAPEAAIPQVLIKEPEQKKLESRTIKKKLRKVLNNAKFTEEVKCINNVKAKLDARILNYRNSFMNF